MREENMGVLRVGDKGTMMGMMEGCRRATLEDPQGDMKRGFLG